MIGFVIYRDNEQAYYYDPDQISVLRFICVTTDKSAADLYAWRDF